MEIRIRPWKDVNPEEIARFTLQVRQQEGLATETTTISTYLTAIEWWIHRSNSRPIVAYADETMVGWLVFFSFVPRIATLGRWHPIVEPSPQKDDVAHQLLRASINHAKGQNFERLEAELHGITPKYEFWYQRYKKWYEVHGFHLATEEVRLEKELTQKGLPAPEFPSEFQLLPLTQFTNKDLEAPFFEMFNNSKDRFWLDQTPEQRRECYHHWFNRERPFVDKATGVLVKNEEIIGLTVVRPVQGLALLGPLGIVPNHRRKGLGKALMAFSFQGALKSGITRMQLEFDITNEPALNLYTELGFTHVHRLVLFALTL